MIIRALIAVFALSAAAFSQNDIPHSTAVETPHVEWAKRLPGSPIKGFFITPVADGRDMAELMERLSLEPTTVSIDREWDINCWGIGDYYGHETRGDRDDFRIVYGYVEKHLTGNEPFDVIVIPGLNGWSRMTRPARDAILRRVHDGAGLVLIHPFVGDVKAHPFAGDEAEGDTRLWDVSPLVGVADDFVNDRGYWQMNEAAVGRGRWEAGVAHYITAGLPLDLLNAGETGARFYKYKAAGEVLIQAAGNPLVAVKTYGKGRVVALGYVEQGYLPEGVDPVETKTYWNYWEYQYVLLARSILWAAGRDGDVSLKSTSATAETGTQLTLESRAAREVQIEVSGSNAFGGELRSQSLRRQLTAGQNQIALPADTLKPEGGWAGGRQIVNVIVKESATGATLDFGAATFDVPKAAAVTEVHTNAPVYRQGDLMSVTTRAAGDLGGLQFRVSLHDDLGRTLAMQTKPTKGETTLFFDLGEFLGREATVVSELVASGGRVVDQLRSKPILVVQKERRHGDYVAYLSFESSRHFLAPTRRRLLAAEGIEPGFTWGGDVNNDLGMPRGYFGVYWYDRGPTTPEGIEKAIAEFQRTGDADALQYLTKKELYKRTGDTRFLVRKPVLDDPAVRSQLTGIARASARSRTAYNMDYYFVGDEGSLTSYSDPFDFSWDSYTLSNFRKWLESQYVSLNALNSEWKSRYKDWNSVMPATTEEARRTRNFAPWADHRTYMEVSFANAYRAVRDAVREGDPDGNIALSGTQVTGPYNGCDWYHLDKIIDHFLSYSGGNQWEMHRSFAKPGSLVGFWTGYGSSGAGVRHQIWTAALTGVLHPNLFWSYSVFNPDLTLSKSARDMGQVFRALKFEGIGRLLMESDRVSEGVALHYSMASVHGAGILGLHERSEDDDDEKVKASRFPSDRDGWVRILTDLGLSPDFVATEQVETGVLASPRTRVFVLPMSVAVSPAEAKALTTFAEAGGIVIADAGAGLVDQHNAWRDEGMLNSLFGIAAPASSKRDLRAKGVSGQIVVTPQGREWGLSGDPLSGLMAAERDVRAAGGQPLLRIGDSDAVIVRRTGKGWAVYLNLLLDSYPAARAKNYGGDAQGELLAHVLDHVGEHPAVRVLDASGHPLGRSRIARYRMGDTDIVALLRDPVNAEEVRGRDGVTVYEDAALGKVVREDLTVMLPEAANVTDVRTGHFLGHGNKFTISAAAGDAVVLALSPSRNKLAINGPDKATRGDRVSYRIRSDQTAKRLLRCHVFGPDNEFLSVYAQNLIAEGSASFVLPTALNDKTGAYRILITDVLTGAEAQATLALK
jgi:hypothetical protein